MKKITSDNISTIQNLIRQSADSSPDKVAIFFKKQPGSYAEHDQFLGISVPSLRKIAKEYPSLPLSDLASLLDSPYNEERLLALIILTNQYKASPEKQLEIYDFYLLHMGKVNNWNLVDSSAHLIIGAHLANQDRSSLLALAKSNSLWERRIAIVSTWYFIKNNDLDWTFKIALILLQDQHDLIHKAVGWMLREAGKKDPSKLHAFLLKFAHQMPRTMLRYSIEKFSPEKRKEYLNQIA